MLTMEWAMLRVNDSGFVQTPFRVEVQALELLLDGTRWPLSQYHVRQAHISYRALLCSSSMQTLQDRVGLLVKRRFVRIWRLSLSFSSRRAPGHSAFFLTPALPVHCRTGIPWTAHLL